MTGRMDSVDMSVWRARYPHAYLPSYFDDVEFLHRPSSYVDEATRIWIAAIFWSMGDESVTILDLHGAHAAREHMLGFGTPSPAESRSALHGQPFEDELEQATEHAARHARARTEEE